MSFIYSKKNSHLFAIFVFMVMNGCGQTYVIFLAKLKRPHFSPGPESSECKLFALEDIPFDSLAFSSMLVTLNLVRSCMAHYLKRLSLFQIYISCAYMFYVYRVCSTWKMQKSADPSFIMAS